MLDATATNPAYADQQVRSTWLVASQESLRRHGHIERYHANLAPRFHDQLRNPVAGVWLPADVAVAHYRACDQLALPPLEILNLGLEVGAFAHRAYISYAIQLARGAGVTPWTVMDALPKLWSRFWRGGEINVCKIGPKDATLEIRTWPCAVIGYTRIAVRGIVTAVTTPVATKVFVSENERASRGDCLSYRVAWV